jgi:phosphohistidine phosphatase
MILYIVRHAWAGERSDEWPDDRQRPLTPDGKDRFAKVVKALVDRGFAPKVIATSPLVRCRQTAEIVASLAPGHPKLVDRPELVPGSDLEGILRWTRHQAHDCEEVAWVGHAPDVEHLAAALVSNGSSALRFAKGGVAAIRFDGPPAANQGQLWWLVNAKILGC